MSKATRDSTRFTATGVWAHTKPGGRTSTLQFSEPAPKNETPQQKVKRLREAANRAKMAQITKWDIAYFYGRMGADLVHRATVYGIVFATGCIGVLAVFSIGDMIVFNRRKRAIYFQNQEQEQAKILSIARDAVASGGATPAQIALVEGIREEEEAMAKKKAERKVGSRLLWWLHGDWKEEKALQEQRRLAVLDVQKEQEKLGITQAVQEARSNSSLESTLGNSAANVPTVGGPLDKAAANLSGGAEKNNKGWFGWAFGGSKKSD